MNMSCLWPKRGYSRRRSRPASRETYQNEAAASETDTNKGFLIHAGQETYSVAFLIDGEHFVSGDKEGMIRKWRIQDGKEVGTPLEAGSAVRDIAVSRDGRWIVGGMKNGMVTVWNAESCEKVTVFKGHAREVHAVDVSPDGTTIATGSFDFTACVWSLSTGERLLSPLKHDNFVCGTRFSPSGHSVATATWERDSVRVYDTQNANLLLDVPIEVNSGLNRSLVWSMDGAQLFALSIDGNFHSLDPRQGTTLTKWPIRCSDYAACVALDTSGRLIAVSTGSLVSFWDITTHEKVGSVVNHNDMVWSMAISCTNYLVVCGEKSISFMVPCKMVLQAGSMALYQTVRELRKNATKQTNSLREIIKSLQVDLRAQEVGLNEQGRNSSGNAQNIHRAPPDRQCTTDQEDDSVDEPIHSLHAILRARDECTNNKIAYLEQELAQSQQRADLIVRVYELKHYCESLYDQGHIHEAAQAVLQMENMMGDDAGVNALLVNWLDGFAYRCIAELEKAGDNASDANNLDEARTAYSAALSLRSANTVLIKWVRMMLIGGSAQEVMSAAAKFRLPRSVVYRIICGILEDNGRLLEAVKIFQQMQNELAEGDGTGDEPARWELDFRRRGAEKLEKLGDDARDSKNHEEAIVHYSTVLQLNPANFNNILLKHSNEIIELEPLSYRGHQGRYTALHGMGHYREAFKAFQTLLSMLDRSPDPRLRELRLRYVDATSAIREVVEETIQDMPRVLIDTTTGRLFDKPQQASAFEDLPIYDKLRSSMTTQLDSARIRAEVKDFYRYVMFSHRWQPHEPTYQTVESISIYTLPDSPSFNKLKNLSRLVQALGFKWAWSDTCCVNQLDKAVQQESLVAMFRWYSGSSLTVVHLLGVMSETQKVGCLLKSIWNTRGWTYQEYLASKVVRFYTEDWKAYLGLDMLNHKESPVIISEMEQAMNFGSQRLVTLQPGLDRAREKLFLASKRQTTRPEDMAYSLFGIFNVALPVIYGEGNQAVGRLLEHILTRSDNVTLLAWTGTPGSHHSYLPSDLTVYDKLVPPHIPALIKPTEIDGLATALRASLLDISLALTMYERFYSLPPLSLVAGRLRLPGIVFPLDNLHRLPERNTKSDIAMYRATSPMLGDVDIQTRYNLSGLTGSLLVHPWISPLLDQDFSGGAPLFDDTTRALRLAVRLKQPFGALLLTPLARLQYRRVATDSLIMVRVREETSLNELVDGIRTVDIQ